MAHYVTHFPTWDKEEKHERVSLVEQPMVVPDGEWEATHMSWLGYEDPLGIAMGCQECADAIHDILEACRRAQGLGPMDA